MAARHLPTTSLLEQHKRKLTMQVQALMAEILPSALTSPWLERAPRQLVSLALHRLLAQVAAALVEITVAQAESEVRTLSAAQILARHSSTFGLVELLEELQLAAVALAQMATAVLLAQY